MPTIKPLPEFIAWLNKLDDTSLRGSKRTQKRDIKRAKVLATLLD